MHAHKSSKHNFLYNRQQQMTANKLVCGTARNNDDCQKHFKQLTLTPVAISIYQWLNITQDTLHV